MSFKRRGIFIITSLFIVLLVMMILAAVVKLIPATLGSADRFNDDQKAMAAAQAGVRYAVVRLQQDFLWNANVNPAQRTVDQPNFVVEEDNGNIFGYMRTETGDVSQFRIRFNFQDGDPGLDNLPDPSRLVQHPYVSVNNLTNYVASSDVPLTGAGPTYAVPDPYTFDYQVPPREVILVVEGLAGDGLRDTTPANLDPSPGTTRRVSRVYIEAGFAQGNEAGGDSVLSGGGDINLFISDSKGQLKLETITGEGQVNVRANGSLNVADGGSPNVTAASKGKGNVQGLLTFDGPSSFDEDTATVSTQTVADPALMTIEWGTLNFTDSSPTSTQAAQIPAGIYLWNDGTKQMEYYDEPYTGTGWVPTTTPTTVSADFSSVRTDTAGGINWEFDSGGKGKGAKTGPLVSVDGDVNVQPTLSTDGVYFLSSDSDNITYEFQFNGPKDQVNTFYSEGDFYLQGPIQGKGTSVIAGGELTITNGGVDIAVNPSAESGVNLYSKGDMLISTNKNGGAKGGTEYGDLKMTGVAYTWGDFTAILNDPATSSNAGKFEVTGALAAYGNDPATNNPGGTGEGNINIWAKDPKLKYDPAFTSAITGATSGDLTKVLWTTY